MQRGRKGLVKGKRRRPKPARVLWAGRSVGGRAQSGWPRKSVGARDLSATISPVYHQNTARLRWRRL